MNDLVVYCIKCVYLYVVVVFFFKRGTTEAEKNDYDNLPEKAKSVGTDSVEHADHALGEINFMQLRQVNTFLQEHIGI